MWRHLLSFTTQIATPAHIDLKEEAGIFLYFSYCQQQKKDQN